MSNCRARKARLCGLGDPCTHSSFPIPASKHGDILLWILYTPRRAVIRQWLVKVLSFHSVTIIWRGETETRMIGSGRIKTVFEAILGITSAFSLSKILLWPVQIRFTSQRVDITWIVSLVWYYLWTLPNYVARQNILISDK